VYKEIPDAALRDSLAKLFTCQRVGDISENEGNSAAPSKERERQREIRIAKRLHGFLKRIVVHDESTAKRELRLFPILKRNDAGHFIHKPS